MFSCLEQYGDYVNLEAVRKYPSFVDKEKSSHRAAEERGSVGTKAENYVSKEKEDLI